MQFKFYIPTKVFFGKDCIKEYKSELKNLGKKAMIVTGKSSGRMSGALADVINVCEEFKIDYMVHDRVENNPSLENVKDGGTVASSFKADFIIGIGGGSPLDAAKAIAVLAVNDINPLELFENVFRNKPLPVITIPTTAGTGSEVTQYSILTRKDIQTKMSFGNEHTFPEIAFLDAGYTESMPYDITVNTAIDTLSHAMEGYLGKRSTTASDLFAEKAIKIFGECVDGLIKNSLNFNDREKLLYASMLGGMTIAHTGTTIIHGIGYSFTYFKGVQHGKANGLTMAEYLRFNYDVSKSKTDNVLILLGIDGIDEFREVMDKLLQNDISLSEEEIRMFAANTMKLKSTANNIKDVTEEDIAVIIKNSLKERM